MQENEVRLNKYLSQVGVCSRREADRMIELNKVYVNGEVATLGTKVTKEDKIIVNGKEVQHKDEEIVLALNKPVGIECTTDLSNKDNIISFLNYPKRVFMVGRLDKKSQGLILLTNNGQLSDKLMRAANYHEKEYIVTVDKPVTEEFVKAMAGGVKLYDEEHKIDTVTRKCDVRKISKYTFSIVLTQGLNRQIRRMCEVNDYQVTKLERVRIMNVNLKDLPIGKYREVKGEELLKLKKSLGL
ncbi:MAG: pseudouridine synthase [Lachnospiraceae bacterium]|nr:pseudouridine synthase [Lachnospiraceae bacterium]